MRDRKSISRRAKATHQTKDKEAAIPDTRPDPRNEDFGNLVPGIQNVVPTDGKRANLVPGIQPIAKPEVGTQPVADTQPADNPQAASNVQPEATSQPESSGTDSSE